MTKSATAWAVVLLCVAVAALALGCGSDKDAPVYDTAANPHGLPAQACDMLDAIEAGQLVSYDVITESFGRLYLENQELLENKHWKEIIRRLGSKFHRRADELIKSGVRSYSQAAGFYMLASFSEPDDSQLAQTAALFATWKEMMEHVAAEFACSPISSRLSDRLDFVRHFIFGDSLQQAFAEQFLVHQLLDSMVTSGDHADLSNSDRAMLSYLNLSDVVLGAPVGVFADPAVDLVDYRVVLVSPDQARFELYIVALEPISAELTVQLSYEKVVSDDQGQSTTERVTRKFGIMNERTAISEGDLVRASTVFPYDSSLTTGFVSFLSDNAVGKSTSASLNIRLSAEMPCTQ